MGTGIHEENAYHRWESGWLPSSSVQTVMRSGTYLLAPEEAASSAVQLLEVPRGAGLPSYWLDFRQPFGSYFDNFSPSDPVVNGVSIRYANSSTMPHPSKSWLIDTTPATPTLRRRAARRRADVHRCGARRLDHDPVRLAARRARADHGRERRRHDASRPERAHARRSAVARCSLAWTAASDDSGDVQHYVVRTDGALLADVYDTTALDPSPAPGRTTNYDVTPIDPAGNVGATSRIAVSVADTTPPSAPTGLVAASAARACT